MCSNLHLKTTRRRQPPINQKLINTFVIVVSLRDVMLSKIQKQFFFTVILTLELKRSEKLSITVFEKNLRMSHLFHFQIQKFQKNAWWWFLHTIRNLQFLSKNSTLISRENCWFFGGEKLVKMFWFWTS